MSILSVTNLTKKFSSGFGFFKSTPSYTAVDQISFNMHRGEILGFLGPNGAGKTTTIQMLLGTLTPSSGSISYFGNDFGINRSEILKRVGYASGYDKLPARLTLSENLDIVARIYAIPSLQRTKQMERLLKHFGLWNMRNRPTGTLSAGQATRLLLAKAFIADPEVVLLDEPTASLDPDVAQEVRQFILAQRDERNTSILITSHNMSEVAELCNRVLVIKKGTIIADNTPQELAQSTSQVHVHLTISSSLPEAQKYFDSIKLSYTQQGAVIVVELTEHEIAPFLTQLSQHAIEYVQISIDKPTLEDYFLTIAK